MCEHSVFSHLSLNEVVSWFHRLAEFVVGISGGSCQFAPCCRRVSCLSVVPLGMEVRCLLYNKVAATTGVVVFQRYKVGLKRSLVCIVKKPCLQCKEALFGDKRSLVWKRGENGC